MIVDTHTIKKVEPGGAANWKAGLDPKSGSHWPSRRLTCREQQAPVTAAQNLYILLSGCRSLWNRLTNCVPDLTPSYSISHSYSAPLSSSSSVHEFTSDQKKRNCEHSCRMSTYNCVGGGQGKESLYYFKSLISHVPLFSVRLCMTVSLRAISFVKCMLIQVFTCVLYINYHIIT